jgi:hypothetical protein
MKSKLSVAVIGVLCIFSLFGGRPAAAATVTIDFTTLTPGTHVSNQYPGVTFSLLGGPDSSGPPITSGDPLLVNSTHVGLLPSANILNISFNVPVYFVSFDFRQFGFNPTTYTAYNGGNTIESGALNPIDFVIIQYGIDDLQINDNCPNPDCFPYVDMDGNTFNGNWLFGLASLSFTDHLSEVPVPAALPLFATGLVGLGLLGRRRKRKVQVAA